MPPGRPRNAARRGREYLTPAEVRRLAQAAARVGRHGHRDATLILLAATHSLRLSEIISLRIDQFDLDSALFHVRRLKRGTPSTHPLSGREVRDLRRLLRDYSGTYVFQRL